MNLQNKVAIVTGAASGLGLATCRALAAAGAKVVGFDLDGTTLEETLGPDIKGIAVDVASEGSVKTGINAVVRTYGAVHVAVNCAGILGPGKTISKGQLFPSDLWNRVLSVNLTGTFNVLRHAALAMTANEPEETGERGVIINTASGAARQGQMGQAAYSASKAGVIGMTIPVARDLAEYGIRVVSIAPGLFESGMSAGMPTKVSDTIVGKLLFPQRMGKPDEFARLVQHIVENAYLNATTFDIECGTR
ncbi:3-hydroxy-2-methylbutyryl-CoA dehydrogenase [Paraburkholderia ginsengiterrae]|uniref:3-hydroxy-2-methylbutyryl-CoA dehydrogenase n=1 Tax=Paraburkholderia ginsengiterrae TaxID=1462993 RepID=A0A1A9N9B1_9BURK|nr:SDR family NAD(P)-dependent oxidoreductase [Paraburkholderia ginsengiterrae]OAJ51630.1 3-hydroxy-2-methylbutyryl-CoA dehydrogenase [Paraburkholderia ginsengiterrae]OAJ61817.1 3-hydroxy-2-methylbutyryl-CoA dehydrogenase [Paraburkholderia ginsengiterrae]